ncbi:hypothetical protein SAMN06265338_11151 [Rhodoblastus acidophilus]|uniref:Uncharacterized protein n=1 Tax=Rhodoblastus acidophilus TaxID=1074 RepID=A0A212S2X0_RHOAC|nr:hypothetical protein [Rhodoblastus acidophilus]PPQ37592.1 hypothetical protein CKO16_13465 [Rhodoblastus acidophilus]RAI16947.1 hypothetical protein CH337_18720 [Rhodoblastus acidophilus]SNB79529.1 hypothetical protein SAMN06265338_11151 [Rhodoblastus acidophilus]
MTASAFRPITVSFTPSARLELYAFVTNVYRGAWGEGLVPLISLEPSCLHADRATGAVTTRPPGFVLSATRVESYRGACVRTLPRLAALEGMAFLLQLPPLAGILDHIDFDWRGDRLLALN